MRSIVRSKAAPAAALIAALLMILQANGCSVIGLVGGGISDLSTEKTRPVAGWDLKTVKAGTRLILLLKDGSEITGRFIALHRRAPMEYASEYVQFRGQQPEGIYLPALGDTVTIVTVSGRMIDTEFAGFDHNTVLVRALDKTEPTRTNLDLIDSIMDKEGRSLGQEKVKSLVASGDAPFLSALSLSGSEETVQVPLNHIQQIHIQRARNAWIKGLLIGAVIDVIIIAIATSGDDEPSPPPSSSGSDGSIMCGCPFVYSFDGDKYKIDSETFGGSIFQAAQRTDLDRLDHLKSVDDICRLKLINELQEIDYVDELKLLSVDHPGGSEIIPSLDGSLHSVSNPIKPTQAVDDRGNNVLPLIEEKDGRSWISDPFGRDPDIDAHIRDGIEIQLPKPRDAVSVKLVLNTQNTFWGAYLQSHFLELHGRDLDTWYDVWNSSPEARQKLQEVMVREGMLLIKLWNGQGWQDAGFIWEVGASISRDQVVRLDVSGTPGDALRIRLESTPGIWTVNSVQVDYSTDVSYQVTEISLDKAVDHQGTDVYELLSDTDGQYYSMDTGDWAELVFSAPPERDGLQRTYVAKSSGYYTIKVPAEGEPQTELLARIMEEPGAFGRYTIQLLNEMTSFALAQ
jgi:hypothetical protein